MPKRKLIAIVAADITETYQKTVINSLIKAAHEKNYNTAVFSSFIKDFSIYENYDIGETQIFDLMNYSKFDGIVILSTTILSPNIRRKLFNNLKRYCHCPVISVEDIEEGFYSVMPDNFTSIKTITEHFIKKHGFTRINCITGPKGTPVAEERLRGYKAALEENGIPVEKERYAYGDFWKIAVIPFADKILASNLPLPQAIVCGNDSMALTLCSYLKEKGIRVPEDICVSGFDRFDDGISRRPQLTSADIFSRESADKAISMIDDVINGFPVERIAYIPCGVHYSESCGCEPNIELLDNVMSNALDDLNDMKRYLHNSRYMSEDLLQIETLDDCFFKIKSYKYLIPELNNLYFCLCDDWNELSDSGGSRQNLSYSERIIVEMAVRNDKYQEAPYPIDLSDMLPALYEESEEPEAFFFHPLSFKGNCFGYIVTVYNDDCSAAFDYRYRLWVHNINNSLEHLRVQLHLQWAMKRLDNMSIIDTLTGVYNRRGYERFVNKLFEKAIEEKKPFIIILGDIDCLKTINDRYGHSEGDVAIKVIAKAFQSSFMGDEICARIGGDEMVIVGCGDYTGNTIDSYEKSITDYLARYNEFSSKPYKVSSSLGSCCVIPDETSKLDDLFVLADTLMYANKKFRKRQLGSSITDKDD